MFTLTLLGADCPYAAMLAMFRSTVLEEHFQRRQFGVRHAGNGWNRRYLRGQLAASSPDVSAV